MTALVCVSSAVEGPGPPSRRARVASRNGRRSCVDRGWRWRAASNRRSIRGGRREAIIPCASEVLATPIRGSPGDGRPRARANAASSPRLGLPSVGKLVHPQRYQRSGSAGARSLALSGKPPSARLRRSRRHGPRSPCEQGLSWGEVARKQLVSQGRRHVFPPHPSISGSRVRPARRSGRHAVPAWLALRQLVHSLLEGVEVRRKRGRPGGGHFPGPGGPPPRARRLSVRAGPGHPTGRGPTPVPGSAGGDTPSSPRVQSRFPGLPPRRPQGPGPAPGAGERSGRRLPEAPKPRIPALPCPARIPGRSEARRGQPPAQSTPGYAARNR